jgi:hypothetical protein
LFYDTTPWPQTGEGLFFSANVAKKFEEGLKAVDLAQPHAAYPGQQARGSIAATIVIARAGIHGCSHLLRHKRIHVEELGDASA